MKNIKLLSLLLTLVLPMIALSQSNVTLNLNDLQAIDQLAKTRSIKSADLISQAVSIDSIQKSRIKDYIFSAEQQYFRSLRVSNYKMYQITYKAQLNLKKQRNAFLKVILTDQQYNSFLVFQTKVVKAEFERLKINLEDKSTENQVLIEMLGWDLLRQPITFVEK